MYIIIYALAFLLVALVSGNNLPACAGSLISSNIVSKRKGIAMAIIGYSIGLFTEGDFLKIGLASIMPVNSYLLSSIVLLAALIVFLLANRARVPQSLSITMSMAIFGLDLALGSNPDTNFIMLMIIAWIASSLFAMLLSMATMKYSYGLLKGRNIWKSIRALKAMLLLFSFLTAFTLGANTIGFVYVMLPHQIYAAYVQLLLIIAIITGSIMFSGKELKTMGNGIIAMRYLNSLVSQAISAALVELATISSIPLSNTQIYVSSIYGSALSYKTHLINRRILLSILWSWAGLSALAIIIGYAATLLLA